MSVSRQWLMGMAVLGLGLLAGSASANSISFSGSSGSGSASVTFSTDTNKLEVTVSNTVTNTLAVGQALSGISFNLSGLSMPTAFTEIDSRVFSPTSGAAWTATSGTAVTATPVSGKIDHWAFSGSSSTVTLTTLSGSQPKYLIIPSTGIAGSGSSLAGPHSPYLLGPTTFVLTLAGLSPSTTLSKNNFSNVAFTFGTSSGEGSATASFVPVSVPLPASVWSGLGLLGALGVGMGLRKKLAQ